MKPQRNYFKLVALSLSWGWLALLALLPFSLILVVSLLSASQSQLFKLPFTLHNYQLLLHHLYLTIYKQSLIIAGICTFLCLVLGYPVAYWITRLPPYWKTFCMMLIMIPFWTSSLIRSYALIAIIKANGLLNTLFIKLSLIHHPLPILFSHTAVLLGLVYNLLPFMILPIMTNLEQLDLSLIEAARDLGANRLTIFRRIILPLTAPGITAGAILVFLPAMTVFYIPDLLGGAKSMLLGNLIQNQFLIAANWPLGSAINMLLTIVLVVLAAIYWRATRHNQKQAWIPHEP